MRLALLLCSVAVFPFSINAETIEANSSVVSVTMYPWGATVVRRIDFEAEPGQHELVVPDLPEGTASESLRVAGRGEMTIGAVSLATGRLPAAEAEPSPEVKAAEAEVKRLEGVLRGRDEAIAAIRLRIDAANEQWAFLRTFGQTKAGEAVTAGDVESLRALTQLVGEEVLKAREAAHDAEVEAQAAERAKEDDLKALDEARRALAALVAEDQGRNVLTMAVETAVGGPMSVEVTTFTDQASWTPVYDIRLSRDGDATMAVERGVVVSQNSGEDWRGVDLVLSTARPSGQSAPTTLYPWLRRIYDQSKDGVVFGASETRMMADEAMPTAAPAPVAEPEAAYEEAAIVLQGATVTYHYGKAVDIRDGVDDLRLKLDTLEFTPDIAAVAVPRNDATAFLVAELTNDAGQILLPGPAQLYLDGAFVGEGVLPLVADGDDTKLGFGPIDGIRLSRTVPDRTQGSRGIITSSNQIDEVAILKVENLTGESWPIRLLDLVPYSEQDDLEIDWRATPAPTETDVDDKRGILAWEFELGAGQTREVRLEQSLSWPDGYGLQ